MDRLNNTVMVLGKGIAFSLGLEYYRIFTWKGWKGKDLADKSPLYYNVQGDKSNAALGVMNSMLWLRISGGLSAELSGSYFLRHTDYKYHPDVRSNTFEVRAGLVYGI